MAIARAPPPPAEAAAWQTQLIAFGAIVLFVVIAAAVLLARRKACGRLRPLSSPIYNKISLDIEEAGKMAYSLFKEEPLHYSFGRLVKDDKTVWDGVENNLGLKHLRNVRKGDKAFFYHTGGETAVIGIMSIISDPFTSLARYLIAQ